MVCVRWSVLLTVSANARVTRRWKKLLCLFLCVVNYVLWVCILELIWFIFILFFRW